MMSRECVVRFVDPPVFTMIRPRVLHQKAAAARALIKL